MGSVNPRLKKENVFERIMYVRNILKQVGLADRELMGVILQVKHYRLGRRKELSEAHRQVHDLLLKNHLKPKTVYEWMLLEKAPAHIKEKLRSGKVSIKDARAMSYAWRRNVSTKAGKEIISQM